MPSTIIRKFFAQASEPDNAAQAALKPRVPDGSRYYVVGDIHGRIDLFEAMMAEIESDDAAGQEAQTTVVLLGDLIDRGPDSAKVVARARKWAQQRCVRILAGNHEEMFLDAFKDTEVLRHFLKHGGRETILSYGMDAREFAELSLEEHFKKLPDLVPKKDRKFINRFEDMIIAGDYVFVHAGIDPEISLDEQDRLDLRWIREKFLRHEGPLPKVVVHGHTIFDKVVDGGYRIGIDTGAYRTGVLTALVLEDDERRLIQVIDEEGAIRIENKEYDA